MLQTICLSELLKKKCARRVKRGMEDDLKLLQLSRELLFLIFLVVWGLNLGLYVW
jgi:hypothetical protein